MSNKAIFIVGPTGVGKTNLAFSIAKDFNGTLVSADSVQVFKGLDIISGKDLPQNYLYNAGYFTHNSSPSICLLDVVEPTHSFNVSDFHKEATIKIKEIINAGKLPVIVGGSGLYVEVLLKGLSTNSKPDEKLRNKLEGMSVSDLQKMLPSEKIRSLNDSDKSNPRRLIRAIEVLKQKTEDKRQETAPYDSLVLGLRLDRDKLKERIDIRVSERIQNGAVKEAEKLFEKYEKLTQQVRDANGYKQLFSYLNGEISLDEAASRWKISEYRHAKNQMTWFEKYGNVKWFSIEEKDFDVDLRKVTKAFIQTGTMD